MAAIPSNLRELTELVDSVHIWVFGKQEIFAALLRTTRPMTGLKWLLPQLSLSLHTRLSSSLSRRGNGGNLRCSGERRSTSSGGEGRQCKVLREALNLFQRERGGYLELLRERCCAASEEREGFVRGTPAFARERGRVCTLLKHEYVAVELRSARSFPSSQERRNGERQLVYDSFMFLFSRLLLGGARAPTRSNHWAKRKAVFISAGIDRKSWFPFTVSERAVVAMCLLYSIVGSSKERRCRR